MASNCAVCGAIATRELENGTTLCSRCDAKDVKTPDCPMCGSGMSLRKGKFGSFWGCMMYPNCMGTKKI